MKARKSTMKKVFSTVAALMLMGSANTYAGTANFTGSLFDVDPFFALDSINLSSSVSVTVNWDDASLSGVGAEELQLDGGLNNLTLSVGSMTFTEADRWIDPDDSFFDDYPVMAHFTDGVLDGFFMNFFAVEATFEGVYDFWTPVLAWSYDPFDPLVFYGDGMSFLDIADGMGAYVAGEIDTAVPLPGAVWLLGSGLLGLSQVRRKKN